MLYDLNFSHLNHCIQKLASNGFTSCVTRLTRITKLTQTSIDHIITNVNGATITPDVSQYSISDQLPNFCMASSVKARIPYKNSIYSYHNIKNVNGDAFRDDLHQGFLNFSVLPPHFKPEAAFGMFSKFAGHLDQIF